MKYSPVCDCFSLPVTLRKELLTSISSDISYAEMIKKVERMIKFIRTTRVIPLPKYYYVDEICDPRLSVDPEEVIRVRTKMIEARKRYLNGES
ncbi:hypothetical protein [Microcystis phage Mvi-JY20]|uniref:Uncharacterized protein n=1 Tax=Microcystis phage Mvi-JY20 TaxID=3128146 RepID=A0AAX4QHX2_9CAUD